jgi:hypothetical protein
MKSIEAKSRLANIPFIVMAIAIGLFAGWIDFNNSEPQPAAFILAICTGFLGFWRPRLAWVWGVLSGLGIPAAYFAGIALGYEPVNWPEPGWYATFGAYWGFFMRKIFSSVKRNKSE